MTTTPKGFTQLSNASPMAGPQQINDAERFVEDLIDKSVATAAALPASGNWPNRHMGVDANGVVYRWNGTTWAAVYGPSLSATKTRATTDNYASGADVSLAIDVTLSGAPAGKYHLTGRVILKSTVANAGTIRYFVNGSNVDSATLDVGTVVTHVPVDYLFTHAGGDLTCGVSDGRSAGTGTVYAGSRLTLVFVGAA